MKWLDGITDAMDMNLGKFWDLEEAWSVAVHGVMKSQTRFADWTTTYEFKIRALIVGGNRQNNLGRVVCQGKFIFFSLNLAVISRDILPNFFLNSLFHFKLNELF